MATVALASACGGGGPSGDASAPGAAGAGGDGPGGTGGGGAGGAAGTGGSGGGAGAGGGGFAAVLDVFAARCTICHDGTKQAVMPLYPQLSLTAGDAYAALVGKPADETCGGTRVVPGDPVASYLMQKLTQDPPCDGLHMPRPFEIIAPPPLTTAELAAISGWISAGAPP
ncbi:MAG TPA: hypothetical protein VIF57_12940 [Polyangia bacterium]|jgi:hypothetical protein